MGRIAMRSPPTALYKKVDLALQAALAAGEWQPDQMLPNEFELASRFGVSQGTARRALQSLVEAGLLSRRQGVGTFVAPWPDEWADSGLVMPGHEMLARPDRVEPELLSCSRGVASTKVSEWLGLRRAAPLTVVRRQLRIQGQTVGFEEILLDAARFGAIDPRMIKYHGGQFYRLLAVEFAARVASTRVWCGGPGSFESWVRLNRSHSLLVERLAVDPAGQGIEWRTWWLDDQRARVWMK